MKRIFIFIPLFLFLVPSVYGQQSRPEKEVVTDTTYIVRGEAKIKAERLRKNVPLFETWQDLAGLENWVDLKMKDSQRFDELSGFLSSAQVYSPALPLLPFSLRTLNLPAARVPAAEWEVCILNIRGKVIDRIKGEGSPPSSVIWHGFPSEDEILQVGLPYSYFLEVKDNTGKIHHYRGESFRYSALTQKEKSTFTISYSHRALFGSGEPGAMLISPEGEMLLRKGTQMLRGYLGRQRLLYIEIYNRKNEWAQIHKRLFQDYWQKSLILSPEDIEVKIYIIPDLEPSEGWSRISVPIKNK